MNIINIFRKWIDKRINYKYYEHYQQIKPGVSVNYDSRKQRKEDLRTHAHSIRQKEMELF